MKAAGNIRLLQPASNGGLEVYPRELADIVTRTAALDPRLAGQRRGRRAPLPAGLRRSAVAAEIWPTTSTPGGSSRPQGVARPVDGGYIFNGRWQFSSGTDHCD